MASWAGMLNSLRVLASRIRGVFTDRRLDEDFQQELDSHLALMTEENIRRGMTLEDARRAAHVRLGGMTQLRETNRELHGLPWLETLVQDLRYGLRQLRRNPGFTAVTILTLALGIGVNTAIFTVIDAVLLRSLPVKSPSQLVLLFADPNTGSNSGDPTIGRWTSISWDAYRYFADNNRSFQGIAAFRRGRDPMEVRWPGAKSNVQSEPASGQLVSGNYFQVLGVDAASGRIFESSDDVPSARPVAVVSHDYWERKLDGDPAAVERSVDLNGTPFTIVGIAPPGFFGERMGQPPPDFWLPLTFQPEIMRRESWLTDKREYWLNFIARLKPGVTRLQAQGVLDVQLRQFLESQAGAEPSDSTRKAIQQAYVLLEPGRNGISHLRDLYSEPLRILMGIVALVLLVSCANVANLLLSRSAARQKEISMRLIAGATRERLIRQMLRNCYEITLPLEDVLIYPGRDG